MYQSIRRGPHLPEDVLVVIFNILAPSNVSFVEKKVHQASLSSVSRTCRQWHNLTNSILYSDITLFSPSRLACLHRTLRHSRKLRENVKSFSYFPDIINRPDDSLSSTERIHVEAIHKLCYRLHTEHVIRSLYKYVYSFGRHRRTEFFNASTHPIVTGLMPVSNLTRLELGTHDYRLGEILLPSLPLPNLQELHLHGFRIFDLHDGLISHEMEWPVMPKLRRLRITASTFITARPLPTHSPDLRVLEIDGGIVFMLPRMFDAMLQYTPNVEYLSIIPRFSSSITNETVSIDLSRLRSLTTLRMSTGLFLASCSSNRPPPLQDLVLYEWQDSGVGDEYKIVQTQVDFLLRRDDALKRVCLYSPTPGHYQSWVQTFNASEWRKRKRLILRDPLIRNGVQKQVGELLQRILMR